MKLSFSLIFLLILTIANAQRNFDVLHYKFSIEINDDNDTIYGKAEIKLKLLFPSEEIKFNLVSLNKSGKGMITDKVAGPGISAFKNNNNAIRIIYSPEPDKSFNDTLTYIITYHGIPADGLIISKNKYGKRTFFADNWPNRAHNWIPCVDDPADKASVEFRITAPAHYQIISNGIKIDELNLANTKKLTHYKEEVPLPTKVMVFGAADFAVDYVGDVDSIPVSSWVYPENKEAGFFDYSPAKDILAWHINYIGPYAYKKLANVQSKTKFGGMENAGAIFYAEEKITGNQQEERLISHEIVHQWFGNMATEKSFAHLWLSEGFATYLTHVYMEARYGTDSMNKEMILDRERVIDFVKYAARPVVDSTRNFMQLLNPNSYQKGGWVLHMLRRQLGDAVFKKSIREYYATYAGKNAESKDLQVIFESISGKDLNTFFSQWLNTPVNPHLKMSWSFDAVMKKINITVEQIQKGRIFNLPMEFAVTSADGKTLLHQVNISKKVETFSIAATNKPTVVIADPNVSLLYEGEIFESK